MAYRWGRIPVGAMSVRCSAVVGVQVEDHGVQGTPVLGRVCTALV